MSVQQQDDLAPVLIHLLKGIIEREAAPDLWSSLSEQRSSARDYVARLGLDLQIDEVEGFAFLRQRQPSEGEPELPRLVARRQLSYPVSLLLALLRKHLAEHDAKGGDRRLILSTSEIAELVRLFVPETANQAKFNQKVSRDLNKIVELGFLRRLKGRDDTFEVRRILIAFIDAQWLAEFDDRLAEYSRHGEAAREGRE